VDSPHRGKSVKGRIRRFVAWSPILLGLAAIVGALGAGSLGLDADGKWGPFRTGLLLVGVICVAGAAGARLIDGLDRRLAGGRRLVRPRAGTPEDHSGRFPDLASVEEATELTGGRSTIGQPEGSPNLIPLAGLGICIVLVYIFFATSGLMFDLPPTSNVYGFLADSLSQGRLDLLIDPPPELSLIGNPYDPDQREGIDVYMDASYYKGRYYAYWGPAPAVLAAVLLAVSHHPVDDPLIVLGATFVSFLLATLIILRLRRLHFPRLPSWLLMGAIIVAGLAHPILWNLSSPAIYEAAIASGQAFLLGGLYFALP